MSEIKVLTKADLLKGIEDYEVVFIEKLNGNVEVRPLSDGEWQKVKSLKTKGIKMSGSAKQMQEEDGNLEIDVEQIQENSYESDCLAVSYSLKGNWSVKDVKKLGPGVPKEIAEKVKEISGVTKETEDAVENFRK